MEMNSIHIAAYGDDLIRLTSNIKSIQTPFNKIDKFCNQSRMDLNQSRMDINQSRMDLNQFRMNLNQSRMDLNQSRMDLGTSKCVVPEAPN
jgi:hypothetical protein